MAWLYLFLAGILEVGWAVGLKFSEGFTRPAVSAVTVIAMILSFVCLALAMKQIPLGTAYPVWTGIGAVGTVMVGILYLQEPRDLPRLLCIAAILGGVVGLRITSAS